GPSGQMNLGQAGAPAGDADHDGYGDFFVGGPAKKVGGVAGVGAVLLVSGRDGSVLKTFDGEGPVRSFGTTLATLGDLDGDGTVDFVAASAIAPYPDYAKGDISVVSGATGTHLFDWPQQLTSASITDVIPALAAGDMDGDGATDVLIGVRTVN